MQIYKIGYFEYDWDIGEDITFSTLLISHEKYSEEEFNILVADCYVQAYEEHVDRFKEYTSLNNPLTFVACELYNEVISILICTYNFEKIKLKSEHIIKSILINNKSDVSKYSKQTQQIKQKLDKIWQKD